MKNELIDLSVSEEKFSEYIGMECRQVEVEVSYFGSCTFFGIRHMGKDS
ncbi:MAG: hypothetical protein MUP09_06860 [Thiovulaceae bacterium]|nr:hypothetical protein [Sulfurimonadaceae bacterium]